MNIGKELIEQDIKIEHRKELIEQDLEKEHRKRAK